MGKKYTNHYTDLANEYTPRERNIQKAKGNPNKNIHQKKNGSNYHYTPTAASGVGRTIANKVQNQEHVKLPTWLYVVLGALFVGILVTLILRLTALKDNLMLAYVSSLLLGITCGVLLYTRMVFRKKKDGIFYSIISLLLTVACLFYTIGGIIGLSGILK